MPEPGRSADGEGRSEPFPDFPIDEFRVAGMPTTAELLASQLLGHPAVNAVDPRELSDCAPVMKQQMLDLLKLADTLIRQSRPVTPEAKVSAVLTAAVRVVPDPSEAHDAAAALLELRSRCGDRVLVGVLGELQAFKATSNGALVRVGISIKKKVVSIEPVYSQAGFAAEFARAVSAVDTFPATDSHLGAFMNGAFQSYRDRRAPEELDIDPMLFSRTKIVQSDTDSGPAFWVAYASAGMKLGFRLRLDSRGAIELSIGHQAR